MTQEPPYTLKETRFGTQLTLEGDWSEEIEALMRERQIPAFRLGGLWEGDNVDFLARLPWLKSVIMFDLRLRSVEDAEQLPCFVLLVRLFIQQGRE